MNCLTPIVLKKSGAGIRSTNSHQYMTDIVPCGKCPACQKRRQSGWITRLTEEQKVSYSSAFLTLTYSPENVRISPNGLLTLDKRDHQLFMKRLRKTVSKLPNYNVPIRYYACGEYGDETHRPHFHSIIFNLPPDYFNHPELLDRDWQYGQTMLAECNVKTITYVTKYISKTLYTDGRKDRIIESTGEIIKDDRVPEFSLMSKGLGSSYITENKKQFYQNHLLPYLVIENGQKVSMPRYYREKLYTEEQRNKINQKTEQYLEENPTFASEKQRTEYTKDVFNKRSKSNLKRKLL
jgi:hypothetical protein